MVIKIKLDGKKKKKRTEIKLKKLIRHMHYRISEKSNRVLRCNIILNVIVNIQSCPLLVVDGVMDDVFFLRLNIFYSHYTLQTR